MAARLRSQQLEAGNYVIEKLALSKFVSANCYRDLELQL